jgi:hypothetical protein
MFEHELWVIQDFRLAGIDEQTLGRIKRTAARHREELEALAAELRLAEVQAKVLDSIGAAFGDHDLQAARTGGAFHFELISTRA